MSREGGWGHQERRGVHGVRPLGRGPGHMRAHHPGRRDTGREEQVRPRDCMCSVNGSWGALTQGSVLSISCETGWIPGMSEGVKQEEA